MTDQDSERVTARTSLGLTTTRAMVAACHGLVQRCTPGSDGGGTVGDICLAPGPGLESGGVMRIVVCDDHLLLLEALGLALGARGHEVVALAGTPGGGRQRRGDAPARRLPARRGFPGGTSVSAIHEIREIPRRPRS